MRRVKIRKGRHYPGLIPFPTIPIPFWIKKNSTKTRSAEFMFTDSCMFNLVDEDQLDVNKLFGFSIGHHQKRTSFRFGWRPIIDEDVIEILAYEYHDGVRQKPKPICKVELNQWYTYRLLYDNNTNKIIYYVDRESLMNTLDLELTHGFGYTLGVYFGGNEKAPQDITIYKKS